MYKYIWDEETGGLLLLPEISRLSKEPRPVYYKELDALGFDKFWNYPKDGKAPLMWAEANNYIYKGRKVAQTKGGSYYKVPEIIILSESEIGKGELEFVNIEQMIEKNRLIIEELTQETIQKVYNTYKKYKNKVDVFYIAFSGGKDSVVALDIVQRALPHNCFFVLFGNTNMEFPDTYDVIKQIREECFNNGIQFYQTESKLTPEQTWRCFGPPSTINRWCCNVHKTSPQINFLKNIIGKKDYIGLAFTGVRSEESLSRSSYDFVNNGVKHTGQISCHTILDWNSAEVFLYIYARKLVLNKAYTKGNTRVGCLVCPNSSGKNDYIKRYSYQNQVDFYLEQISSSSGKSNYSKEELKDFIDAGFWRTRKSGRELNFGFDKFIIKNVSNPLIIDVLQPVIKWQEWGKTIGDLMYISDNIYGIFFRDKLYYIKQEIDKDKTRFILKNCGNTKFDIKFQSLFRSVIIKTLYCVGCGECEAECKYGCINMCDGLSISDKCKHCYKCHDIQEHCLRYASIRNKIVEGKKMAGLDRYFTFGIRDEWLDIFVRYNGKKDFWLTDGDGQVPNKKKDAFKNFLEDAGLTIFNKKAYGDKYTKNLPTYFAEKIFSLGAYNPISWALILCNLVYTPTYNWFVKNLEFETTYTADSINLMLEDIMEKDTKGKGRRNIIDALKIFMARTPLGKDRIFAYCNYEEKVSSTGKENIFFIDIKRSTWDNPDPRVILYSLYKFAEACGDYYQFSLSTLLDDTIERDGVSPTRIFGLNRETMVPILNGLAVNYPEFISASFTLGLETITLNSEKNAQDILTLF